MSKKILVPLANGFEEIEAVTIIDVLRRAGLEVVVASLSDNLKVTGSNHISVKCDCSLEDVDSSEFQMIVLPGGMDGVINLASSELLISIIKEFSSQEKLIGAICAAPYVLSHAQVLKNSFTCYPSMESKIKGAEYISTQNVVVDENIITSKGPATSLEFALQIVKKICGDESYEALSSGLLVK